MCLYNTLDAASKASGYRPDLLHFLPKGKNIMVSNPSSRVRADVHRTSAFDLSNLVGSISPNKKDILVDVLLFVSSQHFRCTFSRLFYGSKSRKKQENLSQVSTCHRFTSRSHASGFPLFPKNNRILSFCSSSEIGVVIRSNILFILS